jgi:predicted outer membrane repeat protein
MHPTQIEVLEARIAPAVFIVTSLADSGTGTLREALMKADGTAGHDTILFHLAAPASGSENVITLATPLPSMGNVTIAGPGATKLFLDGGDMVRILEITDGNDATDSPVTISGLSFVRGNAGNSAGDSGGAILSTESLTLKNCVISGNSSYSAGGVAVLAQKTPGSRAIITNCQFIANDTTDPSGSYGGGLDAYAGKSVSITGCQFLKNHAVYGGGAYVATSNHGSGITISGSVFSQNVGTDGGGILLGSGTTVPTAISKIIGSTFRENRATDGGGVFAGSGKFLIQSSSIIDNDTELGTGGGLYSKSFHSLAVVSSTISGNSATGNSTKTGGAYLTGEYPATFTNCSITANRSTGGPGGGIMAVNGVKLTLSACTVSGNTAAGGGGVFTSGTAAGKVTLTILGGSISNNYTGFASAGGGIHASGDGDITIIGTKILNNSSGEEFGGTYLDSSGSITISGVTVAGNYANPAIAGLGITGTGSFSVTKSLITGNYATYGAAGLDLGGSVHGTISMTKITGNFAGNSDAGIANGSTGTITLGPGDDFSGNFAPTNPDRAGI